VQLRRIRQRYEFVVQIGCTALHSRQNDILDLGYLVRIWRLPIQIREKPVGVADGTDMTDREVVDAATWFWRQPKD